MSNVKPTGRGNAAKASPQGPLYEVVKREVYANGQMNPIGSLIRFLGVPGSNLKATDADGKAIKAKAKKLREAKYDGDDAGQRHQAMLDAVRKYDNELRGIEVDDDEDLGDELQEEGHAERVKAAEQTAKDTEAAQQANSNMTRVQLQGVADPAPNEQQGKPQKK
jgi:hypothetical protein